MLSFDRAKAFLLAGGLFYSLIFVTGCTQKAQDLSGTVVVKVDGDTLTAAEFAEYLSEKLSDFNSLSARDTEIIYQTKNSIVQDFIIASVTRRWAKKNDVFVRKEDLDAAVSDIKAQYPDDIAFRQALTEAGLSYEAWLERQRQNLLQKLVVERLRSKISKPTDAEIKSFYEKNKEAFQRPAEVKISQVVLETEEQANRVYEELRKGRKISELAKRFSIAPEASLGGDLGWISRGTHEMFDTAFRFGVGGKSKVIKSPFGYHIFEVTGRRSAKTLSLGEVRESIERTLMSEREQEAYSKWLEAELLATKVYKNDDLIQEIKVYTRSRE